MRLALREGQLKGVKESRSGPQISHLFFADDCILFWEAIVRSAQVLKRILKDYEVSLGQSLRFFQCEYFRGGATTSLKGIGCSIL